MHCRFQRIGHFNRGRLIIKKRISPAVFAFFALLEELLDLWRFIFTFQLVKIWCEFDFDLCYICATFSPQEIEKLKNYNIKMEKLNSYKNYLPFQQLWTDLGRNYFSAGHLEPLLWHLATSIFYLQVGGNQK